MNGEEKEKGKRGGRKGRRRVEILPSTCHCLSCTPPAMAQKVPGPHLFSLAHIREGWGQLGIRTLPPGQAEAGLGEPGIPRGDAQSPRCFAPQRQMEFGELGCGSVTDMHSLSKLLLGTNSIPEPRPSTGDAKNWVPTPALGDLVRGTALTHYVQRQSPSCSEGGPRLAGPASTTREDRHREAEVSSKAMTQINPQYFLSVRLG